MSDREPGWYWVHDGVEGWNPAHWDKFWSSPFQTGSVIDADFCEIGPRIPAPDELERLHQVEQLAQRFAKAKGRYHSQHATCDLMKHFGIPCVRPGEGSDAETTDTRG